MSKPTLEALIALRAEGRSLTYIADLYNMPRGVVEAVLNQKVNQYEAQYRPQPLSPVRQAAQLRKAGKKVAEIAEILNVPRGTVAAWLSNMNVLAQKSHESWIVGEREDT